MKKITWSVIITRNKKNKPPFSIFTLGRLVAGKAKAVHARERKRFPFPLSELVSSPIRNIGRHILLKGPQAPAMEAKQKYAESCQARTEK